MNEEIIRTERSVSYWSRPDSVSTTARSAWDYFLAEEQAKSIFDRRIPALLFYGQTDRPYWFMQFRNRDIEKITAAEIKASKARTKKLLKHVIHKKTITMKVDETMLADAREALCFVADMLERSAELKERRNSNPKLKTKDRFADQPPPEFTRAQVSRLNRILMQLG